MQESEGWGSEPGWEKERARLELKALAAEVSDVTGKAPDVRQEEWVTLKGSGARQVTWIWMTPGNHGMHLRDHGGRMELEAWDNDGGEKMAVWFTAGPNGIPSAYLAGAAGIVTEVPRVPVPKDRPGPVTMPHSQLCGVLEDISRRVQSGDSLEGSITWAIPEDESAPAGSFDVMATYRIGNRQGQGGMRFIRREAG